MPLLPWRVRKFASDRLPLLYHLAVNLGSGSNSQAYWDQRLAETWDAANRAWPAKEAAIAEALHPDMAVVDIGCGTGGILKGLQKRGFGKLHGLEHSDYAVRRLASEGIAMKQGSLLAMPYADPMFDAAIASEVLEHIIRRDRFLNELTRVVKPSGLILIFVPDDALGPIDEPEHVIKYNAASLRRFLSRHVNVESVQSLVEPHNNARSLFALCRNARR
jgi:ubiquinone/menaquinone biosynthesis C-methylase UbiE